MLVEHDLNHNDPNALRRHCQFFEPRASDLKQDGRQAGALSNIAQALKADSRRQKNTVQ